MRICIIAEGCYPYVAGGVSSWIQMLIKGMPGHEFIIFTIGDRKEIKGKYKYKIPSNVKEIRENFLDEFMDCKVKKKKHINLSEKQRQAIIDLITKDSTDWKVLFEMFSSGGTFNANEFLVSEEFLDIVMEVCDGKYKNTPFNEVFWSMRSMLLPMFNILQCSVPDADIYHTVSTGYAGILGAKFKYETGKPYIVTEHGIYTREREEEILKASWVDIYFKQTWIDFFTSMSKEAYDEGDVITSLFSKAKRMQIEIGAKAEKCRIISNGIDLSRFKDIEPVNNGKHPFVIGAIIRVVPIKDIKTMIYSFDLVRKQIDDAELLLIGPYDEDLEYYEECKGLIKNLECEGIKFVGRVDVDKWLGKLDVVILTSISEGQPFVVLEAMAAKRPVLATDVGCCRELIEGEEDSFGEAGIVTPVMNPTEIANGIIKLSRNYEKRKAMGINGYNRVKEYYLEEDFLDKYKNLYKEMTGRWQE